MARNIESRENKEKAQSRLELSCRRGQTLLEKEERICLSRTIEKLVRFEMLLSVRPRALEIGACRLALMPDRSSRFPNGLSEISTSELLSPSRCYAQSIHQPRSIACRCAQRGRVNAQQGRCPLNLKRFLTARVNRSISDFHVELSLLAAILDIQPLSGDSCRNGE